MSSTVDNYSDTVALHHRADNEEVESGIYDTSGRSRSDPLVTRLAPLEAHVFPKLKTKLPKMSKPKLLRRFTKSKEPKESSSDAASSSSDMTDPDLTSTSSASSSSMPPTPTQSRFQGQEFEHEDLNELKGPPPAYDSAGCELESDRSSEVQSYYAPGRYSLNSCMLAPLVSDAANIALQVTMLAWLTVLY